LIGRRAVTLLEDLRTAPGANDLDEACVLEALRELLAMFDLSDEHAA
jgi:hypothetical protein